MLVRVIPVRARRLAHDGSRTTLFPLRDRETVWETAHVILRHLIRVDRHLVLRPQLFAVWQRRRATRWRRLTVPRRGVVVIGQELFLRVLPCLGPVFPLLDLFALFATR